VDNLGHLRHKIGSLLLQRQYAGFDGIRRVGRRGQAFIDRKRAGFIVDQNKIGKGTADVTPKRNGLSFMKFSGIALDAKNIYLITAAADSRVKSDPGLRVRIRICKVSSH